MDLTWRTLNLNCHILRNFRMELDQHDPTFLSRVAISNFDHQYHYWEIFWTSTPRTHQIYATDQKTSRPRRGGIISSFSLKNKFRKIKTDTLTWEKNINKIVFDQIFFWLEKRAFLLMMRKTFYHWAPCYEKTASLTEYCNDAYALLPHHSKRTTTDHHWPNQ